MYISNLPLFNFNPQPQEFVEQLSNELAMYKEISVNINYAFDGLITKEEVSNDEIDPREAVSVGDEIEVYVISPNDGEGYVELSLKRAKEIKEKQDI